MQTTKRPTGLRTAARDYETLVKQAISKVKGFKELYKELDRAINVSGKSCPKCQGKQREQWIQAREDELLPVPYFHVVFTLPAHLNRLCMYKPALMYSLLFKTAWSVLTVLVLIPNGLAHKRV